MNLFDFPIYTVEDFIWALSFMCKWVWVRIEHVLKCNNTDMITQYYTFFSHPLFQQYAIYKKKYENSINQVNGYINKSFYKKDFKEYIYRYDRNKDYLINKGKETSNVDNINNENCNNIVIYSNTGIETHTMYNRKINSKYRDTYYLLQYLSRFYKF